MDNENRLDIIVFGGTGYTGLYVVENLIKTIDKENQDVTWGVAGRDEKKTREALKKVSSYVGKNLDDVPVILADVKDEDSIYKMCKRGRIIVNCVGPFTLHGEIVLKNCILAKSHHIDTSAEPLYLEEMQLKYHDEAAEAGVCIVGACGFGSIPADVAIMHMQKHCPYEIAWVNIFTKMESGRGKGSLENRGAWDSAVGFVPDLAKLINIRRELYGSFFKQKFPNFKHKNCQKYYPYYPRDIGKLCVPFLPADKFVVKRTQLQNYIERNKRPIQLSSYLVVGSWLNLLLLSLVGIMLGIFSPFSCGRKLLRKYPSFFTLGRISIQGPTRKQISEARFEITLVASGWKGMLESPIYEPHSSPEKLMIARWRGPHAGAEATSIMLVQSAITMFKERDAIGYKGGVLTPGLAFQDTSLVERLGRHGVVLEIIKSF